MRCTRIYTNIHTQKASITKTHDILCYIERARRLLKSFFLWGVYVHRELSWSKARQNANKARDRNRSCVRRRMHLCRIYVSEYPRLLSCILFFIYGFARERVDILLSAEGIWVSISDLHTIRVGRSKRGKIHDSKFILWSHFLL